MRTKNIKTYSELITFPTFIERFEYAKLQGVVGEATFGFDRYLNQIFYDSREWQRFRESMIIRDNGCDLAIPDRDILYRITLHHLVPVDKEDIIEKASWLMDPEFVVCVSDRTHKAIHYGDSSLLMLGPVERTQNDTCPWR